MTDEQGAGAKSDAGSRPAKSFGIQVVAIVGVVAALAGGLVGYAASGHKSGRTATYARPAAPSASLAPPVQLQLGETGDTTTGSSVTVYSWAPGAPGWPKPDPGYVFSRAVVKFCSGPGVWNFRIREIPYLFNLVDSEGGLIDPEVDVRFLTDELASYNVGLLSPGECVTGSIIFRSLTSQTVSAVRFTGHGRFDWDVSGIANGTSPTPRPSGPYSPGLSQPAASSTGGP